MGLYRPRKIPKNITLYVEGSISSGKSTFLHELRKGSLEFKDKIAVPLSRGASLLAVASMCACLR